MSENYNIFKVLNFKEKETIHSAMIAAIASYNDKSRESFFGMLMRIAEKKAIGKAFDKKIEFMIKNTIDFNSNKFGHWIKNEAQLWESVNRNTGKVSVNRGRADIWIGTNREIWKGTDGKDETKQYRLIIENKISAGNQDHQLRRYYRYLTETSEKKNHREFAGLFSCVRFMMIISSNKLMNQQRLITMKAKKATKPIMQLSPIKTTSFHGLKK